MSVLPYLTTANTVSQIVGKVNDVIDFFDDRDAASELVYVPFGPITANNIQTAVQQVEVQANTKITTVATNLTANVVTLNTTINTSESRSLANAIALAIALG